MKKLFVVMLAIILSIPAFSQLKFGIKAGLSTNSISMADVKTLTSAGSPNYTVEKLKGATYGINGGLFMRLSISKFYIQPEVLFASSSNEYKVTNTASLVDSVKKQKFNKLEIPVMVGFKLLKFIRINAGPSASLAIGSPAQLIKDPDYKTMYSKMTFGYQAGVGLDLFKKLTVDLRYEGSLKKYQNKIENALGVPVALDDRPNAFLLSVGIIF